MKNKIVKISAILFFTSLLSLCLPVVQSFLVKNYVNIFTNLEIKELKKLKVNIFSLNAELEQITLKNKRSETQSLTLSNLNFNFKENKIFISCDALKYKSDDKFNFSNISNFSPKVLANFLNSSLVYAKKIKQIDIKNINYNGEELSLHFANENQSICRIYYKQNSVNLIFYENQIKANGIWNENKINCEFEINSEFIKFSGNTLTPYFFKKTLGENLSFKGFLVHQKEWQLKYFQLQTSNNYKITGNCAQELEKLNGLFFIKIPKYNENNFLCFVVKVNGYAKNPILNFSLDTQTTDTLKSLSGTINIVNDNQIKITSEAFHDNENNASCNFDLSISPLNLNGELSINALHLEKLLHNFFPDIKGKANVKASFQNVKNFNLGTVNISANANLFFNQSFLPININANVNNGIGNIDINITKGNLFSFPLSFTTKIISDNQSIKISDFCVNFSEFALCLQKSCVYYFEKGMKFAHLHFLGGQVLVNDFIFKNNLFDSIYEIIIKNVDLSKLNNLFKNNIFSGALDANIKSFEKQYFSLKANKVCWKKKQYNQFYNILKNLSVSFNSNLENQKIEWNFSADDNSRIKLLSQGKSSEKNFLLGSLKGKINLNLLADLIATKDRIHGDLEIDLTLKGDIKNPSFSGNLIAKNGIYENNEVGTFYKNITIIAVADHNKLVVKKFTAQDIRESSIDTIGQLKGDGNIDFSNFFSPVFNISLFLNSLRIAHHDGFIGDASGILKILGEGSKAFCSGEVTIENATFYLDQGFEGKVSVLQVRGKKNILKNNHEYSNVFPLDILVHAPPNSFKVIGMGAETSWNGDFYVKKSIVNPFLVGSVYLTNGTLDVLGRNLKITKGKITFIETDRNNPIIDILASKNIDDGLVVGLEIKGSGKNTIIDFTSKPQLQKEEILSLLIFGKRLGEVSVLQSMQLASIANQDKQNGGDFFTKIRSGFGFDEFEFKTVTRNGTADDDATAQEKAQTKTAQAIRIGKDFGAVRVAVEQGASTETTMFVVSTPITDNLVLQGDVGAAQNSGVGISWVRRY